MKRLVATLAVICILMVLLAGSGAFLLSKIFIAKSKVDAVAAVAKGVSVTLSEQVNLLNSVLDKMAQDPDIINAAAQNNPELLATALKKLENHFPGILSIKFLLPESNDPNKPAAENNMGFADLEMAKKTFTEDQVSAIQGDSETNRHLAIARRIMQNNKPVAVVLVGLNYDFVNRALTATALEKGYIELRQDKLVLASAGKKHSKDELDDDPINVPNTIWQLYFENSSGASVGELSLMVCIILIPALAVGLGFVTGYRKLSDLLSEDISWVTKAFKDILTEKPLGEYPVKLSEMSLIISTLAQFKRVVSDSKRFEI
jgi:phosphomannomutase / phosphoglucomutase